jgi:hypothetical protein
MRTRSPISKSSGGDEIVCIRHLPNDRIATTHRIECAPTRPGQSKRPRAEPGPLVVGIRPVTGGIPRHVHRDPAWIMFASLTEVAITVRNTRRDYLVLMTFSPPVVVSTTVTECVLAS